MTLGSSYQELTALAVETAAPPAEGQRFIRDTVQSGLALRITANGAKAYVVEVKVNGRSRRTTIGKADKLSIKDARRQAKTLIGQFAQGHDVVSERREARLKAITFGEVFEDYLADRDLKPRTVREYQDCVKLYLVGWKNKPITAISGDMVQRLHQRVTEENGPARANAAMRVARALFRYAAGRYQTPDGKPVVTFNPVQRLSATKAWNNLERRRGYIKAHELPAWWAAVQALPNRTHGDFLTFLVCTGVRLNEARNLVWSDVDLRGRTFSLHDTKARRPVTFPLSTFLCDMLARRQAEAACKWVFPSIDETGPVVDVRKSIDKVESATGLTFTPHDLRRSYATILEYLDLPYIVIKKLLNHSLKGDVTGGYLQVTPERLREPVERVADFILRAAGVKPSAAVVLLPTIPANTLANLPLAAND